MQPEKMIPITPPTLTEEIKAEQDKLRLMRQRSSEAGNILTNYQATLDKLREESDQAFYLHTSQPSKVNDKAYADAKAAVMKLIEDKEEAESVRRRLPDRLKNAERLIHSLQRKKQSASSALAIKKYSKKCELAMGRAEEAISTAVAMTALMSESGSLDSFMGLGSINTHELVNTIVSKPEFRELVNAEHKKLLKALKLETV